MEISLLIIYCVKFLYHRASTEWLFITEYTIGFCAEKYSYGNQVAVLIFQRTLDPKNKEDLKPTAFSVRSLDSYHFQPINYHNDWAVAYKVFHVRQRKEKELKSKKCNEMLQAIIWVVKLAKQFWPKIWNEALLTNGRFGVSVRLSLTVNKSNIYQKFFLRNYVFCKTTFLCKTFATFMATPLSTLSSFLSSIWDNR